MASLTQEMNGWWNEMDTAKEISVSQSSMSLSKDLPSLAAIHTGHGAHGLSNLSLTNQSTRASNSASVSTTISHPIASSQNEEKCCKSTNSPPLPFYTQLQRSPIEARNNIIYDNKKFSKFQKTYTNYSKTRKNKSKSLLSAPEINRISSYNNDLPLCYKETIVSSRKELKRCVDEYKALKSFCTAYYGTDMANQYTALYINKKKGSTSYPKKVRLIMKYHEGEDLDDFLVDEEDGEVGFLYETDFRAIVKKILHQLSICHTQGIIHCDLKPHNIRINELSDEFEENDPEYYDVHIIDFGFSQMLKDKKKDVKLSYIKGTPGFIAPETIKNKKYSTKADMFGVGCVAFFLLTNNYAVIQAPNMSQEDMMPDRKRIKRLLQRENDRNRDDESRIAPETIDFVLSCLWKNPTKRPTAVQALNLPIFQ